MKKTATVLCATMLAAFPAAGGLWAADTTAAIARPYGTAWLNGAAVNQSSAIFPGDLVQTATDSAIKIGLSGSSATILSDSLVKFEGGGVAVEHGSVKLVSSNRMSVRAGSVTAMPVAGARTEFELTEINGSVRIVAEKGDVQIVNGTQTTILSAGHEATQKDSSASATNKNGLVVTTAAAGPAELAARSLQSSPDAASKFLSPKPEIKISPTKP